jgi:hypothetical protein
MYTRDLHRFLVLILAAVVPGCVSDISHDSRYPTDYKVGATYRLKQPVFAEMAGLTIFGTYSELILLRPGAGQMPSTVQDFERAPHDWKEIAGLAQPGTLIQVTKIQLENNAENGKMVWIRGRLLDVSWAKKTAELAFISRRELPTHGTLLGDLPMVDTNILELVPRP